MSSTTRLLVLGVVELFQPVHGYEVRRELISWRAQEWASVQPGSIYNALKTLTRDGLLEVVGTDQVGGRPERTTYRLTSAGEEEFHTLLREEWWTVRTPIDPLMAAVSFLGAISRAEAIAALEHRIAQIHGVVRHMEFAIEAHDGRDSPFHVREMMRLMNARIGAEIAWSQQFIARLRDHEYTTADEPPWQPPPTPPDRRGPRRGRIGGAGSAERDRDPEHAASSVLPWPASRPADGRSGRSGKASGSGVVVRDRGAAEHDRGPGTGAAAGQSRRAPPARRDRGWTEARAPRAQGFDRNPERAIGTPRPDPPRAKAVASAAHPQDAPRRARRNSRSARRRRRGPR